MYATNMTKKPMKFGLSILFPVELLLLTSVTTLEFE